MRRSLVALTIALTAVLAACTSASAPGWTYAPPTEPPASQPAASGDASAAPSGAPSSGAPSSEAPATGDVVEISAMGVQFEQKEATAPADTAFTIRFDNKDAGIPHNVEVKDAGGAVVFKGDIFNGVAVKDYAVDPLAAGTYQFLCIVHPNMIGTLKVGG